MEVKTIDRVTRLGVSSYGNPRFRVHFTDGTTAETQTDASINYGIENTENIGVPVNVTYSRAGRITHVVPVNER